jgi:hypothetical protein
MGYSMRTERYRFTRWLDPRGREVARELYDHAEDPLENENVAGRPEHERLVQDLTRQLEASWKAVRLTIDPSN